MGLALALTVAGPLPAIVGLQGPVLAQSAPATEQIPAPTPAAVLLQEDFEDPAVGLLPTASEQPDAYAPGYVDGEYFIRTLDPTRSGGSTTWLPGQYDNTTVSVDARLVDEADNRFVALVCRGQGPTTGSEYDLILDPAGSRFMLARFDKQARTRLAGWTTTPAINPGTGANRLELTCAGSTISGSINGTRVDRVLDRTFANGEIGLQVGTFRSELLAQANFDNLQVASAALPPPPPTPTVAWSDQFGTAGVDRADAITRDGSGAVYVVGTTAGALRGQRSAGGTDVFVRKLDAAGTEIWIRQFGAAGDDRGTAVAVDKASNVFVAGRTESAMPAQHSAGNFDAFIRKLDPNGNELWTNQFGTAADDDAIGLATDAEGNAYAVGRTRGTLAANGSSGGTDAFLRKYTPGGKEVWTRQFGAAGDDAADGVAIDPSGNIYVAGHTRGALPGQLSSGNEDAYLRAFDATGSELWTRQFGTDQDDVAYTVATDTGGGVFVAGITMGNLAGQPLFGYQDAFVRKYDVAGNELWTRQFGSSVVTDVYGVGADLAGNVHVVGEVSGPLPDQPSVGQQDAYVVVYAGDGSECWTYQFGSGKATSATSVAIDSLGSVYLAGEELAALPGATSAGSSDAFVVKLLPPQ
jgi:hypothetical protein